uniref:Secreted protein n=1 Tax=Plectus sambesii TaxID=2011161 RepID=A0A914UL76_9BILA
MRTVLPLATLATLIIQPLVVDRAGLAGGCGGRAEGITADAARSVRSYRLARIVGWPNRAPDEAMGWVSRSLLPLFPSISISLVSDMTGPVAHWRLPIERPHAALLGGPSRRTSSSTGDSYISQSDEGREDIVTESLVGRSIIVTRRFTQQKGDGAARARRASQCGRRGRGSNAVATEAKVEELESSGGRLSLGAERRTQLLARSRRRFAPLTPLRLGTLRPIGQGQFSDPSVRVIHRQCAPPLLPFSARPAW